MFLMLQNASFQLWSLLCLSEIAIEILLLPFILVGLRQTVRVAALQESGPERRKKAESTDPREQCVGSSVAAFSIVELIWKNTVKDNLEKRKIIWGIYILIN